MYRCFLLVFSFTPHDYTFGAFPEVKASAVALRLTMVWIECLVYLLACEERRRKRGRACCGVGLGNWWWWW